MAETTTAESQFAIDGSAGREQKTGRQGFRLTESGRLLFVAIAIATGGFRHDRIIPRPIDASAVMRT
jgi:hypothetical protein